MERIDITIGDFRKNAGIVGMNYLLKESTAAEDVDYGISEDGNSLWIAVEFALKQDWTELYFKTFVKRLGATTTYQRTMDKIKNLLEKLQLDTWKVDKETKEDLKFINDKLLSNSYQSGFQNIKNDIQNPEVYEQLKKEKLKDKMEREELIARLEKLQEFLAQDLCEETFSMKSLLYTYINRFWDGKSFLLRSNAKKEMRETFTRDFTEPFLKYLETDHTKAKDSCIDCGYPVNPKEKVSIAFMTECADDLARKKSAFWNGKVDAYLCPVCAFVYAVSPLGFQVYGNHFVFLNTSDTIEQLLDSNCKEQINSNKQGENETYSSWMSKMIGEVLKEKSKQITNLPIIIKGIDNETSYQFQIIQNDVIELLGNDFIRKPLEKLQAYPNVKVKNEFWNVYEKTVWNILRYQNQYQLINRLLKESLDNNGLLYSVFWIQEVQKYVNLVRKYSEKEEVKQMAKVSYFMAKDGNQLRKDLMNSKNATSDECLRGTIYQLLNALSVKNKERFFDIVLRLYCGINKQVPTKFFEMIEDQEKFLDYGYAFIIGLKGGFFEKDNEN